mmetsp:Transcript_124905/g.233544  ORF Transcript_124905/g.233544 Transcript_124905/m.233544 type:complete len:210 (+) Transcript_124905:733-1362(+)
MQKLVHGLYDLLHLYHAFRGSHIVKSVCLLPLLALLEPLLPLTIGFLYVIFHGLKSMLAIRPNLDCGIYHLAKTILVDVYVDDATGARYSSSLCLRSILVDYPCGAIIKSATYSNDEVRLLNGKVGVCRPVHTKHVQGKWISLVKNTHAMDRGSHGNLCLFCDLAQNIRAMACTLPNVEDRALRLVDEFTRLSHGLHIYHGWRVKCRSV